MVFRSFARNIREQNWFEVTLDLIVVVVGIYIGLQADAFMSGQQDRDLEIEYLERLVADMEESLTVQRELIGLLDVSSATTDYIAELQRNQSFENVDVNRLIEGLNNVGWVPAPNTNMVTVRELQSTGNIALIRDVAIRTAIGQFARSFANAEFSAQQNLGFMSAAAPEIMTWSYMSANVPGEHQSVTESMDSSFGYTHNYDVERMLQNPDGARITSWVSGWSKYYGAVLMQHHEDTREFLALLQEQLTELN